MNWILVELGEEIRLDFISGVGPVKAVKVTSGKGQDLIERTVFNFYIRLRTGVFIKSQDYPDEATAAQERVYIQNWET